MSYANFPPQMRAFDNWFNWKLVPRGTEKPTKVPIDAKTGHLGDTSDPATFATLQRAIENAPNCSGVGFAFTEETKMFGADCDNTLGDEACKARQVAWWQRLNTYTEFSPSGTGVHIIGFGRLPGPGVNNRKEHMELYDRGRFFTMTGNVWPGPQPVAMRDCSDVLPELYAALAKSVVPDAVYQDQPQTVSDEDIQDFALKASNGDKYQTLFSGDWTSLYQTQSEADLALIDIISFYSQNEAQVVRLFFQSALGKRAKARRRKYVADMIRKARDQQVPVINVDGLKAGFNVAIAAHAAKKLAAVIASQPVPGQALAVIAPKPVAVAPKAVAASKAVAAVPDVEFPPGLVGLVAEFLLAAAPRPVRAIALCGAIGFLAGIAGRGYNVSATGLNQYILLLADTGRGKEAITNGINRLAAALRHYSKAIDEYLGPGDFASAPALIRELAKHPCFFSIIAEFGVKLREMTVRNPSPVMVGLKGAFLDLYSKSGSGQVFGTRAYSNQKDNIAAVTSPSLTIIGESNPDGFYENINEGMVRSGLMPRFMITEYEGIRVGKNKQHEFVQPSTELLLQLTELLACCAQMPATGIAIQVRMTPEAEEVLDSFDKFCDAEINSERKSSVMSELWNRADLKTHKLAALYAVGRNCKAPVIEYEDAVRACNEIKRQVEMVLARFRSGNIGSALLDTRNSDEALQDSLLARCLKDWMTRPFHEAAGKYRTSAEMFDDRIFSYSGLQIRLTPLAAFKSDRLGAAVAIDRSFKRFVEAGDLYLCKHSQMTKYKKTQKAFAISDPDRFLLMDDED